MRYNNKSYLRWILFAGSLCPISIPLLSFDLSLERVIVPIIAIYLILSFLFNEEIENNFILHKYTGLSFLITFIIISFSLFFIDFQNMGLPIRLLYNLVSGYIIYILFTFIYDTDLQKPEYFIFSAIIISLIFYLYNSFSISRMAFISKIISRDELGVNPNSILNSVAFLLIINQLYIIKNSTFYTNALQMIFVVICSFQFSRQNLVSGIFLIIHSVRKNKYFLYLSILSIIFIFYRFDLRIFSYILKGVTQISGQTESTRLEWWTASLDHIINYPYFPRFTVPVDNTLLTLLLHTGLIFGIVAIIIIFIALIRIGSLSLPILFSLMTLFILNDVLYEASFWFIVFSSLDSRIIKYRNLES